MHGRKCGYMKNRIRPGATGTNHAMEMPLFILHSHHLMPEFRALFTSCHDERGITRPEVSVVQTVTSGFVQVIEYMVVSHRFDFFLSSSSFFFLYQPCFIDISCLIFICKKLLCTTASRIFSARKSFLNAVSLDFR